MKAIASADLNWGIGRGGQLLQRVPDDMKHFRKMTTGKVVVMGRETFESLPGRQPLKDRVNIVLSRSADFNDDRIIICRFLEDLFNELGRYGTDDIFVIGGESVYTQLLPYCSEAYVTRFEKVFEADRRFPNLDAMDNWVLVEESERRFHNEIGFRFLKYINKSVQTY
jgi:dihydrofolate reductase